MAKKYRLKRCGFVMGEYSSKELKAMNVKGELHPEDEIQKIGDNSWYELKRVNGLGYESSKANQTTDINSKAEAGKEKQRSESDKATTTRLIQNAENNCSVEKTHKPNTEPTEHCDDGRVEIDEKAKGDKRAAEVGNDSDLASGSTTDGEEPAMASEDPSEDKSGDQPDYFASLKKATISGDLNSGNHHGRLSESKHEYLAKEESESADTEDPFTILDEKEQANSHESKESTNTHLFSSLKNSGDDPFASLSSEHSLDLTQSESSNEKSSTNAHFKEPSHQEPPCPIDDEDKYFSSLN